MSTRKSLHAPRWVRSAVCLIGALSIPGLIYAATLGVDITYPLASVVGVFAYRVVGNILRLD